MRQENLPPENLMSYTANFDTAKIYLKTGLKARAREYLVKVIEAIPADECAADNLVYLKTLTLLARLSIEGGERERCIGYVDRGLAVKPDHADLLFLKALLLWDDERHDEMFLNLMGYLGAVVDQNAAQYEYEYSGQKVVAEALYKLLPESYAKSASRPQLAAAISDSAASSANTMIQAVHKILQEVDAHGKKEQAGISGAA